MSVHNGLWPNFLESRRQIYGVSRFSYELIGPIPEHNPYRPTIPESLIALGEDYYDYAKENQEILREQHNLTQAGDTTFPYQLFMDTHDTAHYRLGSVGRFYHPDYGIIQGRYVKFDEMVEVETPHCPVGLFATKKIGELDWRVTNDINKSHADLVVGISAPFVLPENGKYGWVIVDGPVLQQVKNESTTQAIGEAFAWSSTGAVSNSASGKVIGRRVNKSKSDLSILTGQMLVRTESLSEGKIREVIDDQTKSLQDAVEDLQNSIGSVPGSNDLQAINDSLEALQLALNQEIGKRTAADLAIQQQFNGLDFVTQNQLENAVTNATTALSNAQADLQMKIDEVRAIALDALNKANQALAVDFSGLQDQINTILNFILAEKTRAKGRFPVVDGAIPPNLVYLDNGSLVYVETF